MTQRPHRLVEPAVLRQRHARQRVDKCEVTQIAGGMEGGRGLRDVLANDGAVANLPVAEAEFVMGETDGTGIVRPLGLFQRACKEGDAA